MQKILFIAYQFPPRGGPGVQRSVNFVKHLREFGYEPVVLTVDEQSVRASGGLTDESLLRSVPEGIEIVRTPSYEPVGFVKAAIRLRLYRFFWFFFYGIFWESSARWSSKVYPLAAELIRKHGIRLVYTSSGPFSVMELGKKLKEELGVKWVADLRDPFTDAYAWDFPSKFHWKNRRRFEERVFPSADKLIVNTPEVRKLYLARKLSTESRMTCITNGY